jgi:hypothetical protein
MEHGPGCHQVVSAVFNRVFEDIKVPDFEVWYNDAGDVASVDVAGNDMTAGRNPTGQPLRRRSIATSNLEAAPPALKTKLLDNGCGAAGRAVPTSIPTAASHQPGYEAKCIDSYRCFVDCSFRLPGWDR